METIATVFNKAGISLKVGKVKHSIKIVQKFKGTICILMMELILKVILALIAIRQLELTAQKLTE